MLKDEYIFNWGVPEKYIVNKVQWAKYLWSSVASILTIKDNFH